MRMRKRLARISSPCRFKIPVVDTIRMGRYDQAMESTHVLIDLSAAHAKSIRNS